MKRPWVHWRDGNGNGEQYQRFEFIAPQFSHSIADSQEALQLPLIQVGYQPKLIGLATPTETIALEELQSRMALQYPYKMTTFQFD